MKLTSLLAVFSAICCLGTSLTTSAQAVNPALTDTHTFYLGAFYQDSDGALASRVENSGRRGIDIDDLGLDTHYTSWLAGYRWRFGERWMMNFNAHIFNANGDSSVSRTFEYDGQEFEAGARLRSNLSVDTYLIDVMYSLYKSEKAEFQLGGGMHAFDFDTELTGTVSLEDESRSQTSSGEGLLAPLPNLRVNGLYAFTPKWVLRGSLGWLSVDIDNWNGEYTYLRLSSDYRISDHLGIGLGYRYYNINVSHRGSRAKSTFDLSYRGPALYLKYGF